MIRMEVQGNDCVVRPNGKITAANADEFRKELQNVVEAGAVQVTIDLADVEMIDSRGLAVFVVCHQTLSNKGGSLIVVTDNEDMRGLFQVMRLDQHFTVRGSE